MSQCETCGMPIGFCSPAAHRMADRIAKLEAFIVERFNDQFPCDLDPPAAAGHIPPGYKLAPGWEVRTRDCRCTWSAVFRGHAQASVGGERCGADGSYYSPGWATSCAAHAVEMGAIVKVESPAEQPASAGGERRRHKDGSVCAAADRWTCYRAHIMSLPESPPAPAQGAPAEPLSERIRTWSKVNVIDRKAKAELGELADECAALEARLAEADRSAQRHRLVLDEERRCYEILKTKLAAAERDRDAAQRALEAIKMCLVREDAMEAAIRDGKPAPK